MYQLLIPEDELRASVQHHVAALATEAHEFRISTPMPQLSMNSPAEVEDDPESTSWINPQTSLALCRPLQHEPAVR